jgi:tRNA/tmRNA/rRNA uracil-C5-methylase (TrmA/RlmC/RlmD family)
VQEYIPKYKHVVAVVDPPRAGLHRSVVVALLGCAALKRLVYVSCNPSSLVVNGQLLCGAYKAEQLAGRGRGASITSLHEQLGLIAKTWH